MNNLKVPIITCFEHQFLHAKDFVDPQDFDYLLEQELPCFVVGINKGETYLKVRHYLAKILLPSGCTLEILPKIDPIKPSLSSSHVEFARAWVKQMLWDIAQFDLQKIIPAIDLSMASDSPLQATTTSLQRGCPTQEQGKVSSFALHGSQARTSNPNQPWYEWLLNLAADKISAAHNIIPTSYHQQFQNYPQARGKINLSEQVKSNWHRPHYLYSEQAVLKDDELIRQFLATAWLHLQRHANGNETNKATANHLQTQDSLGTTHHSYFKGVKILPTSSWEVTHQTLIQSYQRWHGQLNSTQINILSDAITWAWWVLQPMTVSDNSSHSLALAKKCSYPLPFPALLINMNHAFETWVLTRLKAWVSLQLPKSTLVIQPDSEWLYQKHSDALSKRGKPYVNLIQTLKPDALIRSRSGHVTHVIDIKYKNINKIQDIHGADWQQMSVYQHHFKAVNGWLVYPMTAGFNTTWEVISTSNESKLSVIPFNVSDRQIKYDQ